VVAPAAAAAAAADGCRRTRRGCCRIHDASFLVDNGGWPIVDNRLRLVEAVMQRHDERAMEDWSVAVMVVASISL